MELLVILKIFANEHRLAILKLLKERGEKSVGQIADHLKIPLNTTSKNLLYLNKKGILKRRYEGPFVLYAIQNKLSSPINIIISKLI
jgi:DNA-binding transcriptional ArsR family regulator